MQIIKKDGTTEQYNEQKIIDACNKAARRAMVNLSDSLRAWDALTRNQTTMVRLEGSNLAAQNLKYISHSYSEFEPSIYVTIPRVLDGEHILEQTFVK